MRPQAAETKAGLKVDLMVLAENMLAGTLAETSLNLLKDVTSLSLPMTLAVISHQIALAGTNLLPRSHRPSYQTKSLRVFQD